MLVVGRRRVLHPRCERLVVLLHTDEMKRLQTEAAATQRSVAHVVRARLFLDEPSPVSALQAPPVDSTVPE